MNDEYLVSYGRSGEFGRFRPESGAAFCRGDEVVVAAPQGLEIGHVLCPATPSHGRFLSRTAVGRLLRLADDADRRSARNMHEKSQQLFEDARRIASELYLPWEILDAEVSLDGRHAQVHYLGPWEAPPTSFLGRLIELHELSIHLQNWAQEAATPGCGRPDCGHGDGGCDTCTSDGGCSSCGKSTKKEEVAALLAGLQQNAEQRFVNSLL